MAKHPEPDRQPEKGEESLDLATPESLADAPMMMTVDEIANCLQVSVRTIWRLKAKGDIPKSVNVGRAVRWKRSDILDWIERGCPPSDSIIDVLKYVLIWRPIYMLIGRL